MPDFRLKRIYEEAHGDDGWRVLVDRLWPRGLTRSVARIDAWEKDAAPSPELRVWFGHDPARFESFAARYREELTHNPEVASACARIARHASAGNVTLLYAAKDDRHNHAIVLREHLIQYWG